MIEALAILFAIGVIALIFELFGDKEEKYD